MPKSELKFQNMINDTNFLTNHYYSGFYNTMHKHTIELLFDGYTHRIPDACIVPENRILCRYPNIYKRLGKKGDLDLIKRIIKSKRMSLENVKFLANGAAQAGHIYICEWMIENDYPINEEVVAYAAKGNQMVMLEWLIQRGFKIDDFAVKYAAKKNHLQMLQYLVISEGRDVTYGGYYPALNGYLDIVQFLFGYVQVGYHQQFLSDVRSGAIRGGHLNILEFAYGQGHDLKSDFVPCKDINILRWLIDNEHIELNHRVLGYIIEEGNFECFEYFFKLISPVLIFLLDWAICVRNERVSRFLLDMGCTYNSCLIMRTVQNYIYKTDNKTLPTLQLFKESEWPPSIFNYAASCGDLEILQHGYDNGCFLGDTIIDNAASNGHLHVIIWARKHNYKWSVQTILNAIDFNDLDVLKWLRNIDNYRSTCKLQSDETEICPWDESVCLKAIKCKNLEILKCVVENGCEYGAATYVAAEICRCEEITNYMSEKKLNNELINTIK